MICRKIDNKKKFTQRCKDTANDGRGFIIGLDDDDLEMIANEVLLSEDRISFTFLKEKFEKLIF